MASRLRSVAAGSSAQHVVAAQLDQYDVGLVGHHPVDALQTPIVVSPEDAVIDDGDVTALVLQRLQAIRKGLGGGEAVSAARLSPRIASFTTFGPRLPGLCMSRGGCKTQDQRHKRRDP